MGSIRFDTVFPALAAGAASIIRRQVDSPGLPGDGALVRPDWGIPEPTGSYSLVTVLGLAYIGRAHRPDLMAAAPPSGEILERMDRALGYILDRQRPTGRIDLLDCNYDSSPDSGFAVQALCPVIELGRPVAATDPAFAAVLDRVECFSRNNAVGMLDGGFHTPNHRWVMAAAMAWAGSLFPEIPVGPVVDAYLAEGIDADEEGFFIEHSAGVYDAICDKSLLILDGYTQANECRDAACRNLLTNLMMMHADGTMETGLSRRQDHGLRPQVPGLILPFLLAHRATANPVFLAGAQYLHRITNGDAGGLMWYLLRHGEPEDGDEGLLPTSYARYFPANGLWRAREGQLSASVFRGRTHLLSVVHGGVTLCSVKIAESYFGTGRFVSDEMQEVPGGVSLVSLGESEVEYHRPGYDLPLGRRVAPGDWRRTIPGRDWRPMPPNRAELLVEQVEGGLDLTYRTLGGLPGVMAQMAFDFAPGGVWETGDLALKPVAGQVLMLKSGAGSMRVDEDVIEIGTGAHHHSMWQMRDAEAAPGLVRVLLTFRTPVDHTVRLRVRSGYTWVSGEV